MIMRRRLAPLDSDAATLEAYRNSASEADIQLAIVQGLRAMGYIVCEVERYRSRCVCGRHPTGGHSTPGTPDLFVTHERYQNRWYGLEVKKHNGKARPEQAVLVALGVSVIVRSFDDAVAVVEVGT